MYLSVLIIKTSLWFGARVSCCRTISYLTRYSAIACTFLHNRRVTWTTRRALNLHEKMPRCAVAQRGFWRYSSFGDYPLSRRRSSAACSSRENIRAEMRDKRYVSREVARTIRGRRAIRTALRGRTHDAGGKGKYFARHSGACGFNVCNYICNYAISERTLRKSFAHSA